MPDVVIDSTVLVSAFLTARPGGASHELLRFAAEGAFTVHLSPAILRETEDVLLTRRHLRERYTYADEDVRTFIANLQILADVTGEIVEIPAVVRDPNDDMVIACAAAVGAGFIVTRDRDLRDLERHGDIAILSPEDFLARLRNR
jgi:putative PIN family toxin of toxin-antitoxin system